MGFGKNDIDKNNKTVRGVTLVHFLLMFGYKLFSAYFPLFLAAQGFSLVQVGWSYLLIYLPIALCAPLAGFFSRRVNPVLVMILGIIGYAAYALMMVADGNNGLFFFWQIMLGVSASLFFTSSRILLMAYPAANMERGFSWFYNAPFWADVFASAIGGFLIWRAGFTVVFALSVAITLSAAATAAAMLWKVSVREKSRAISLSVWAQKWRNLLARAFDRKMAPGLAVAFAGLWVNGLFAAFFILFLKNELNWSRDGVIAYTAYSSAFFSIAYIIFIRPRQRGVGEKSIVAGAAVSGAFAALFAAPIAFLNFATVFALSFFRGAGEFICQSGRSAFVARKMEKDPEEAGAFDTIFSPLGIALGSMTAGLLIGPLGYRGLFSFGGLVMLSIVLIAYLAGKTNN
ncbi:MAG: MFS transporter [Candidatus Paceibacterota bacterium]